MAKNKKGFNFSDITDLTQNLIKKTSIVHETAQSAAERKTIGTGVYILNAVLSGDIMGGIADNRITVFAGESGVGKSFLCYNICAQAQKEGYGVIYIDTEHAIDLDQLPNYGIDIHPDKFMLVRSNVIEDMKIFTTQLLDKLKEQKQDGNEIDRFIFVLDSVGMMGSRKEIEDAKSGKEKADMTKAKALASYFRIITSDLSALGIPMICTNHTYKTLDLFPQDKMKGGNGLFYSASSIAFMTKAKLKTGEIDDMDIGQSGLLLTIKMVKNRMVKPKRVKMELSFASGSNPFSGLDTWCTPENFDKVGIAKGKMVGDEFVPGGNRWYVRHLGKHVKTANLHSKLVFNDDVLKALRPIIKDYFRYKSVTELQEIENALINAKGEMNDDEYDNLTSDLSTDKLFD
jgi:RecA/RadA recombinase